jgi:putative ABC transport system permease protein
MFSSLVQDIRFAYRQFVRAPGFVAATVVTLALGIGATTAIFSVVRGVLLRALPYPGFDRIVQIWQLDKAGQEMQFSDPNFDDLRAQSRSFSGVAQFANSGAASVSGDIVPTRAAVSIVSHDFFNVFAIAPALGRVFLPEEEREGGAPVAVLSSGFWERVFGRRPDAIGKRLTIGDRTFTVVGVVAPQLDFPVGTDVWISRAIYPRFPGRTAHNWQVVGRVSARATVGDARREASVLAHRLAQEHGSETMMADVALVPLREQMVGAARPTLLVLLVASIALLFIACANVANLLVARLTARRTELALRMALGAARSRLVQQCLAESVMLALAGGTVGVALAVVGTHALIALDPSQLPRSADVRLDPLVLLFALGVSGATAFGLALVSAWRGTQGDLREMLSSAERTMSGTGSSVRTRQTLVVAQVAMTCVLLIGAGLLAHSLAKLLAVDPGFHPGRAVVLDVAVDADDSVPRAERTAFYSELFARLSALPGVSAVGGITVMPLGARDHVSSGTFIEVASPTERISLADMPRLFQDHSRTGYAEFRLASGDYFTVMHIPLLEGRTFDDRDAPNAQHVAVISASLARARWSGQSPIGKWVEFGNMDGDLRPFMIVGVVGDVREAGLDAQPKPTLYASYLQRPIATSAMNVVVAASGDPGAIIASARDIVSALRPDVSPRFRTVSSIVSTSVAGRRLVLFLVGVFAFVALLLSALGLYSIISYFVAQRARELGIRAALGAGRTDITWLVLREGAVLTTVGIGIGAMLALSTAQLLRAFLFGVSARDPVAFLAVPLAVAGVALAACWIPAHRAARTEASDVLRS